MHSCEPCYSIYYIWGNGASVKILIDRFVVLSVTYCLWIIVYDQSSLTSNNTRHLSHRDIINFTKTKGNSKSVYRQSQVRMPNGSGVEWSECLLLIGTFLAWSSIAQSVCQRAFSLLEIGLHRPSGSNPAFSRGRQLVSFRFENRLPGPEHRK